MLFIFSDISVLAKEEDEPNKFVTEISDVSTENIGTHMQLDAHGTKGIQCVNCN